MKRSSLRIRRAVVGVCLGFLAAGSACDFKYEKEGAAETPARPREFGQAAGLGYAAVNAALFQPNCLGCHATRSPNLASYEAVVANIREIQEAVLVRRTMPRKGPLSEDLQSMLSAWIAAGMPREGASPAAEGMRPVTGGIPRPYTFANLKADVLGSKCIICHHGGTDDEGATPFEKYADLMSVQEWIKPYVTGVVNGQAIPVADQMPPPGAAPLTDSEKALFYLWIGDGYRDENGVPAPKRAPDPVPSAAPSSTPAPLSSPSPVIPSPDPSPGVTP